MNTVYAIGNTHFDPVWLWTWDEAMAGIRSTFVSALARMEEDSDYIYSFCCPAVFEWMEEVDPDLWEQIKSRVAEGRWDIGEGWWLQPDCNVGTGESYVRQGLYGQNYLMTQFGRTATTVFNSDSFGHAGTLPQILRKCGISYYVFTRPEPHERTLPEALFRWKSPDGSEVLAYRLTDAWQRDVQAALVRAIAEIQNGTKDKMVVYGVSNHGGAPTKKAIESIQQAIAQPDKGCMVKFSSTNDFFVAQKNKSLPIVESELQVTFFGTFSNFAEIKRNNRWSEYALLRAETAAHLASLYGKTYPLTVLTQSWKDTLFNQFHDIIGGSCVKQAYTDARNLHGRAMQSASEVIHKSLQYIAKQIAMLGQPWNLVVFNLTPTAYEEVLEAEVQWVWELDWYDGNLELVDSNNVVYPCQLIRELSVIPQFRSRFAFLAKIPAMGYQVFHVRQIGGKADFSSRRENVDELETPFYRIHIGREKGDVSITDLRTNRTITKALYPFVLQDDGDTWSFNVNCFGAEQEAFHLQSAQIIEAGEVQTTLKLRSLFRDSWIEQYFTFYAERDTIDCRYRVNWNEKHKVLKVALPTDGKVSSAAPYGIVTREADGREYPVNEWLESDGIRVFLDGIFAYNTKQGNVGLTILRSPVGGDLRIGELEPNADYWYLSQGIQEGKIRMTFAKEERSAQTMQFLSPPIVIAEAFHTGDLPTEQSYLRVSATNVAVTVIKHAEDESGDIVLRSYETVGKATRAEIRLYGTPIIAAHFAPYEIKTFRLSNGHWLETDMLERE